MSTPLCFMSIQARSLARYSSVTQRLGAQFEVLSKPRIFRERGGFPELSGSAPSVIGELLVERHRDEFPLAVAPDHRVRALERGSANAAASNSSFVISMG